MFFRFAGAKVQRFFDTRKYLCDFFAFWSFLAHKWGTNRTFSRKMFAHLKGIV